MSGHGFHWPEIALWPLAFATLIVVTVALSLWFAAVNVRYRDVGHLLGIALLVWFWATPIVYASYQAQDLASGKEMLGVPTFALYLLNPLTAIVEGFHVALYQPPETQHVLFDVSLGWMVGLLGIVLVASIVLLRLTWGVFFNRSADFAEEL